MTLLYVDDERSAHTIFQNSLGEYKNILQVSYHFNYNSALDYAKTHSIDCAFLDISLLDKDGIALAKSLRKIQSNIEFVFITGYDDFARAAYEVGGRAYLTKPYSDTELQEALKLMQRLTQPWTIPKEQKINKHPDIFIKTFGSFDLLIDGVAVYFKYSKAKELLAFLVHQMGGSVTNAQIFYALWDHQTYTRDNSTYVRRSIRLLKQELANLGLEDMIISMPNSICIDTQKFTCDAYELLNGNKQWANSFIGDYMSLYPWAKTSIRLLEKVADTTKTDTH